MGWSDKDFKMHLRKKKTTKLAQKTKDGSSYIPTESEQQIMLFEWAELMSVLHPELKLLHAIPNGGKRHIATAVRLKKEGVKKGVPDVFLPVPKCESNKVCVILKTGLYIEMKSKKGKLSESQQDWIERLRMQGYRVEVCCSFEEARDVILDYLGVNNVNDIAQKHCAQLRKLRLDCPYDDSKGMTSCAKCWDEILQNQNQFREATKMIFDKDEYIQEFMKEYRRAKK